MSAEVNLVDSYNAMMKKIEEESNLEWLGLPDVSEIKTENPFEFLTRSNNTTLEFLRFLSNPDNFYITCKVLFGVKLYPLQLVILQQLWNKPFPMLIGSRGMSKSWLLSLYIMLRLLFHQGCKIAVVGAVFRQAKVIFEYCEHFWHHAPVYRSIVGKSRKKDDGPKGYPDRCIMEVGDSRAIFYPLGNNKLRGERANYVICDEFSVMPLNVFEQVISGFGIVSSDPMDAVIHKAKIKYLKKKGLLNEKTLIQQGMKANQIIISGTAFYDFNWFADYWRKYKSYIKSGGDKDMLEAALGGPVEKGFNWRDYCVMRIPVDLIPEGFMDEGYLARQKATASLGIFTMEYGACFIGDSDGFFKRSLIEGCTTTVPVNIGDESIQFHSAITGDFNKKYVFGVDPASESDNFAIVIVELNKTHRRVVYSWTTGRKVHQKKVAAGLVEQDSFYSYCALKIRELMRVFPCEAILVDSGGGGISVEEALHDKHLIKDDELPIWPIINPDKPRESDKREGLHLLHMISFSDGKWVAQANHGLKRDLGDKTLLFPYFDPTILPTAADDDQESQRIYDTLEECVIEVEELKKELTTIIHSQTQSGRERWDTPDPSMKKDRYSALLMANAFARESLVYEPLVPQYRSTGGFIGKMGNRDNSGGQLYVGHNNYVKHCGSDMPYRVVKRGV